MISLLLAARNITVALMLSLTAAGNASSQGLASPAVRPDRVQGLETAPITLIEYSSPTCWHCVAYHNEVAPRIHAKYVKTGKVKLIYRPFVRNAADAAIFILAESRTGDEYHAVLDAFYKHYDDLVGASDVRSLLEEIAATVGIDAAEFSRLLMRQDRLEPIQKVTQQAVKKLGVTGTPTFFVNDTMYVGMQTFEMMSAAIEQKMEQ